jgi:hypothetical protein
MALITMRYNWQRDELTTGQGEIAPLWSVDERTVKREMARSGPRRRPGSTPRTPPSMAPGFSR